MTTNTRASVLCIDDDEDFAWGLQKRLEEQSIRVIRATDGIEGFLRAFADPVDAILLDYQMPNGRGDYVLGRLKDNPVTCDVPVIVLTGTSGHALRRKMSNLGAVSLFTKPVDVAALCEEIGRWTPKAASSVPVSCGPTRRWPRA